MKKILIFLFLINVLLGMTACSKHEHIIEIKEGFEPTCELNGEITHYYCINCNKIFNDSKGITELNGEDIIIPMLGHYLELQELIEPTCNSKGTEAHYTCLECAKTFSDSEGNNEITNQELEIPLLYHKDENNDFICDYACGLVLLDKLQVETILNDTFNTVPVLVKDYYISGAIETYTYIENNLIYVSNNEGSEKLIYLYNGLNYIIDKNNEWSNDVYTGDAIYNCNYVFNQYNIEINSDIFITEISWGSFSGRMAVSYKNSSNINVGLILNESGTLLDGILIYDEYNNIIHEISIIIGENQDYYDKILEIKKNFIK